MSEDKPWHEDKDFWKILHPFLFTERRWGLVKEEVDGMIELISLQPGEKVLDLCCGPGRHSLELARRGFVVTGVDRVAMYLEEARENAEKEGLSVELVEEDMRNFRKPETFDAAINFYTSFGYFAAEAEDVQVLANLFSSLKPGGRLLIDLMGSEVLARRFCEQDWLEVDGIFLLEERKVEKDWTWVNNRWIVFKDGVKREFRLTHRLYSAAELAAVLRSTGFEEVKSYGDITATPYDHTAKRLIITAKRTA